MFKWLSSAPLHDPLRAPAANAVTDVKCTTCYMCACRCGIRVHLRDGEVRYIDGNPAHPLNQGVICAKGAAGIMKQVSPARLTTPLLRKPGADRGAGEFEAISAASPMIHFPKSCRIAPSNPACRCVPPAPATSAAKTASCWSITTSASPASTVRGPVPTVRVSSMRPANHYLPRKITVPTPVAAPTTGGTST